ncbi:MAG: ribosome-associated translation inhibitor RaiA, partial [Peptococcaceae bacterium]|nr:ribosome-associated translation inhibitor RaiA [Peptococcaceae bacterium]
EVTNALKEYVYKRVGKLEKYSDEFQDVQVTLLVVKDRHRVEITAPINGVILRGEEETADMYSSIDLVIEKLERQIEKYRTRLSRRLRTKGIKGQDHIGAAKESVEEDSRVVRYKTYSAKPLSVDEAIMQMNLVGHTFFVFVNEETQEPQVVYQRRDGDYGLLRPEK